MQLEPVSQCTKRDRSPQKLLWTKNYSKLVFITYFHLLGTVFIQENSLKARKAKWNFNEIASWFG